VIVHGLLGMARDIWLCAGMVWLAVLKHQPSSTAYYDSAESERVDPGEARLQGRGGTGGLSRGRWARQ
jgi:hypothetical protein